MQLCLVVGLDKLGGVDLSTIMNDELCAYVLVRGGIISFPPSL